MNSTMSNKPDNDLRKALVRALQEHAGAAPTPADVDVDVTLCVRCRQEPRMNDRGICRRCLDEIRASVGIRTTRSIEERPKGSPLL